MKPTEIRVGRVYEGSNGMRRRVISTWRDPETNVLWLEYERVDAPGAIGTGSFAAGTTGNNTVASFARWATSWVLP